jgi:hypothetical protein
MKQTWLVGAVASVLFVAGAAVYTPAEAQGGGAAQVPAGETSLGTVSIPRAVMADGKPLPAGRYTLRLTPDTATTPAPGADPQLSRWVEFVQNGQVRGRELASIVPADQVKDTMPGPDMPARGRTAGARVEMLRGGDYLRVWVTRNGTNYLLHLPPA